MKFRVERDVFADAVAWAARSLPVRPSSPVLAGLLIEASDAGLVLSTVTVAAVSAVVASSAAVSAANIGAFGVLWVAKYFVLDGVVFAPAVRSEELAAA